MSYKYGLSGLRSCTYLMIIFGIYDICGFVDWSSEFLGNWYYILGVGAYFDELTGAYDNNIFTI